MKKIILFNKPYGVLSQFTDEMGRKTLKDYIALPGFYAAGRLDRDSEGLLVLTNDGKIQNRIAAPKFRCKKTYYAQLDGEINEQALNKLRFGVTLNDGDCQACVVSRISCPDLWQREPPVRYRKSIPTSWISIAIHEGRNRQVRRMTAAVGYPTLRLVRVAVGPWRLDELPLGQWRYAHNVDIENF